jgi:transcription antitermination factor NusG
MRFPTPAGTPAWFALSVRPRLEAATETHLQDRGLEAFVPWHKVRRRWSDRIKELSQNLFPGYVFARFAYENQMQVLNLPGVQSIIGFSNVATTVPESELQAVRTALHSGLPIGPWPYITKGQRVRVKSGVLEGTEGTLIREKDAFRVVLSVHLLQRSIAVEIDRDVLTPVK